MGFSVESAVWYLKYAALPMIVGGISYKLYVRSSKMKLKSSLKGQVVVITGASSGIGESLAHLFYELGCNVVLAARRETELNRVKQELLLKNVNMDTKEPTVLPLDLADLRQVDTFVKKIYEKYDKIDILINNSGVTYRGSILHTKFDVERQVMNVNYFGTVALTKAVLPEMVDRRSGHIVLISSILGLIAVPNCSAYAASKHAMQAFGDALRAEMHQHNVDVTVVNPGYVKTAITLNAFTETGGRYGLMDSTIASRLSSEYCASRILDAVIEKRKELVVSHFDAHLAVFLRRTVPSLYFWAMTKRADKTKY